MIHTKKSLRVRLAYCGASGKIFYWLFQGGTSFVDHLCYLCLVFVMLSRLFIATWERDDLLALVCDVYCDFVTFPFGILGQVRYLIVSILKGKQDNVRNNDRPYYMYLKPIWYWENYLLKHKQFRLSHFSLHFMISISSQIICNDFFKIERKIRIPAPCFFLSRFRGLVCNVCHVSWS